MPATQSQQRAKAERSSRIKENKRRHRARHKEYVQDLEQKLAQAREEGIQATKEMQLAARTVAQENTRLRHLLRMIGYSDRKIDDWVRNDRRMDDYENRNLNPISMPGNNAKEPLSVQHLPIGRGVDMRNDTVQEDACTTKTIANDRCSRLPCASPLESDTSNLESSGMTDCTNTCTQSASSPRKGDSAIPPCKLLTLLAENPAADITQVALLSHSDKQPGKNNKPEDYISGGVECSSAYKLLMQYATSEEKTDKIAAALESGCTPSATGGCKVKTSVIWKVLDEEII